MRVRGVGVVSNIQPDLSFSRGPASLLLELCTLPMLNVANVHCCLTSKMDGCCCKQTLSETLFASLLEALGNTSTVASADSCSMLVLWGGSLDNSTLAPVTSWDAALYFTSQFFHNNSTATIWTQSNNKLIHNTIQLLASPEAEKGLTFTKLKTAADGETLHCDMLYVCIPAFPLHIHYQSTPKPATGAGVAQRNVTWWGPIFRQHTGFSFQLSAAARVFFNLDCDQCRIIQKLYWNICPQTL